MRLTTSELDQFVRQSDDLGGPGTTACTEYWADVDYLPDTIVDELLDPFSTQYVEQQVAVYNEMSGRALDQLSNEHTTLDVAVHAAAINPYAHISPGSLSTHVERLSRAIRFADPPIGGHLLDMGCGWGLSSEVAAYSGLKVTAVDVNSDFVDLVNRRALRFGHDIVAQQGAFDTFWSNKRFDAILFYECFHHALCPWELLARMRDLLRPGGRIVMAGEPINQTWWKHWGLRLDPLSVYCIRKFGWLESGWSREFLASAFHKAGLNVRFQDHLEGEIGTVVVGTCESGRMGLRNEGNHWRQSGWLLDDGYLVCQGESHLMIEMPGSATAACLRFQNFRGQPVQLQIRDGARSVFEGSLSAGQNDVHLDRSINKRDLFVKGFLWVPNEELHNGDIRRLSLHLEDIIFF